MQWRFMYRRALSRCLAYAGTCCRHVTAATRFVCVGLRRDSGSRLSAWEPRSACRVCAQRVAGFGSWRETPFSMHSSVSALVASDSGARRSIIPIASQLPLLPLLVVRVSSRVGGRVGLVVQRLVGAAAAH